MAEQAASAPQPHGCYGHVVTPCTLSGAMRAGSLRWRKSFGAGFTAGDVTSADVFTRATQVASDGGRIAGLVYAVGTINLKPLGRLTEADFEQDFRVNALGAAIAVQAALPALKAGDEPSSVVLFSTVAVAQGFASHASISMAKGAVEGLTLALAAELAPKVRVNAIAPSLTRTSLAQGLVSNETVANGIAQMHALPRLGTAEDIAALAAFWFQRRRGSRARLSVLMVGAARSGQKGDTAWASSNAPLSVGGRLDQCPDTALPFRRRVQPYKRNASGEEG